MRVLTLDIETKPNVALTWGLFDQTVSLGQLVESSRVLCFAWKWENQKRTGFTRTNIASTAHTLLDQADVVVHYNGTTFDIKHLQAEMARAGLTPPSPFAQVDLLRVVRQKFRLPSSKLEYVASELLGEGKASTGGMATWVGCMNDDPKAWARMEKYNRQDVVITEKLFQHLKPWISNLPNPALYADTDVSPDIATCAQCGSTELIRRGLAYTRLTAYVRYSCNDCGRWQRGKHQVRSVNAR